MAGDKLKEAGYAHWDSLNKGAINESGFTALPGGWRGVAELFYNKLYGLWWTSTESSSKEAWIWEMKAGSPGVFSRDEDKRAGYSVRCVRDK